MINEQHFEQLYKSHFATLYRYAYSMVRDAPDAESIVQNVFLKLWEKRQNTEIHTSWQAYLFRATYHEALNLIKHSQVRSRYAAGNQQHVSVHDDNDKELSARLHDALLQLPEKCRTVFQMSRFEDLKYQEIATKLGISLKTVEAHMGKALKTLRVQLADFLTVLILWAINQHL